MKKSMKQVISNEKNRQIKIYEKLSDLMGTKKENRSTGKIGQCIFAFLFKVLIVTSQLRFYLVVLVGLLLGQGIVGWVIRGQVLIEGEIAVCLIELS